MGGRPTRSRNASAPSRSQVGGRAVAEAGEDRRLDLGVGAPPARGGRVRDGGAARGPRRGRRGSVEARSPPGRRGRLGSAVTPPTPRRAARVGPGRSRPPPSTRPERAQELDEPLARRVAERQQRRPEVVALQQAHRQHRGLRRHRVRGALEVGPEQRQPAVVDPPGLVHVAARAGRAQRRHLARDLVARHGHDAVAAHREDRERRGVVAGQDGDVARPVAADHRDLLDVAARLLDRDHARVLGEPQERVGLDVGARPATGRCRRRSAGRPRRRWPGSGRRASAGRAGCSRA